MVLESTAWGEAFADYASYTVFHGFVAQKLGFGFGQTENHEKPSKRYKRYKPLNASTVYAVIWFFTAWGSTAWGKLLPTIRLYPLYTVLLFGDRRPGEASADDTALYGVLFLTVFHGFAAQRLGFEFEQTQKR